MSKRFLAVFLALLLSSSLYACSESETSSAVPAQSPAENTVDETEVPAVEETEPAVKLEIPEEDNGGRDFHILVPTEKSYEFVTESTGESVNDAVFERSMKTEEHFNIKFS